MARYLAMLVLPLVLTAHVASADRGRPAAAHQRHTRSAAAIKKRIVRERIVHPERKGQWTNLVTILKNGSSVNTATLKDRATGRLIGWTRYVQTASGGSYHSKWTEPANGSRGAISEFARTRPGETMKSREVVEPRRGERGAIERSDF